mmetsp:Transcript_32241/g.100622  ORF Transcript_32241/g.100622 Transcript_32241/m.100622 type:complete len:168 (+) Transcript_32241:419-922(+)
MQPPALLHLHVLPAFSLGTGRNPLSRRLSAGAGAPLGAELPPLPQPHGSPLVTERRGERERSSCRRRSSSRLRLEEASRGGGLSEALGRPLERPAERRLGGGVLSRLRPPAWPWRLSPLADASRRCRPFRSSWAEDRPHSQRSSRPLRPPAGGPLRLSRALSLVQLP